MRKFFLGIALACSLSARGADIAITHVNVVDVEGGVVLPDRTVLVHSDKIVSVGGRGALPKGAAVVDGRGKFLIPGLWDMHVHLSWKKESALRVLVATGVTAVRDLGGYLKELDEWRVKIESGAIPGPRIFRAGPILNGQAFNRYQLVPGGVEEMRGTIRALKHVGVDFIKVHRRTPREWYFAAIDESKKQGLDLVGHIPMTVSPEEATDAGQATIEHVATLFEGTFATAVKDKKTIDAMKEWRTADADELFARFVKNGTIFDPTLYVYNPDAANDPRTRYVASSYLKEAEKQPKLSQDLIAEQREMYAEFKETVRQANRAGVTMIAGSDIAATRVPGFTLHEELVALVECGLSPLRALQTATINSARAVHKENEMGSIAAGKVADLVLLDDDPLAGIHNTQKISAVVAAGKLYRRADLDAMLSRAVELAKKE